MDVKQALENILGKDKLKTDIDLSAHLTIKVKSIASFYFEAESIDDFIKAKQASLKFNLPLILLGGGSNLAFTKSIIKAIFVKNKYLKKEKIKEDETYVYLLVSSGYPVTLLVRETTEAGLQGFEHHLGLPGTVGGAIYMNAKWTRPMSYFGDNLSSAKLIDNKGNIKEVNRDYFQFDYDYSILHKTKEIVLNAVFKLKKADKEMLLQKSQKALEYRKQTQPFGVSTSGCFFKNTSDRSAGYFIDKASLKGVRVGNFIVSQKHANFIINEGGGKPEDLDKLLKLIKEKVKAKFGVELEEEVVII